jgi:hypothetical protein
VVKQWIMGVRVEGNTAHCAVKLPSPSLPSLPLFWILKFIIKFAYSHRQCHLWRYPEVSWERKVFSNVIWLSWRESVAPTLS